MNSIIYSIMTSPQMFEFLNDYDYSGSYSAGYDGGGCSSGGCGGGCGGCGG